MNVWQSVPLMTAIDLIVIVAAVSAAWAIRRARSEARAIGLVGPTTVAGGLVLIAGFFAADLVTMWLLPSLTSHDIAMKAMESLHLNWSWLVLPAAVLFLATGIVITLKTLRHAERTVQELNETLEQRVALRTRQLEEANKELESFAYSTSHDLRAPLRSIGGFCEIIRSRYLDDLNEEALRYFGYIVQSSEHMEHLVDDLLLYSRLSKKAGALSLVPLDDVLQRLGVEVGERFVESGGSLSLPVELPQVHGHRSLLSSVFTPLIDNALAYRHPDRPPQVEIDCRAEESRVVVSVSDNGVGIAPEFHKRIFEIFQRLHRYDVIPGTGVGLAIVSKAAKMMDGRVWVESRLGEGSTFFVELPTRLEGVTP